MRKIIYFLIIHIALTGCTWVRIICCFTSSSSRIESWDLPYSKINLENKIDSLILADSTVHIDTTQVWNRSTNFEGKKDSTLQNYYKTGNYRALIFSDGYELTIHYMGNEKIWAEDTLETTISLHGTVFPSGEKIGGRGKNNLRKAAIEVFEDRLLTKIK